MATEFNPGGPINRDSAARESINPPMATAKRSNWGAMAVAATIAGLIILGLLMLMRDTDNMASDTTPAATTGSSTPSPSNPPPAPGPRGQGESNSTR
jgi:hypothetical protein